MRDAYIIAIQANCENKEKVRIYYAKDPLRPADKASTKESITRSYMTLGHRDNAASTCSSVEHYSHNWLPITVFDGVVSSKDKDEL